MTENLYFHAYLLHAVVPDSHVKKASDLMLETLQMGNDFISRISHTEPGNAKQFYKKFHADLRKEANTIWDGLTELEELLNQPATPA
ncbi:MAG: hypothetical protein LBM06_04895 [Prevotellaceae bacterium]|nr:hypothetical protein [Prevotellaceae bacterium]